VSPADKRPGVQVSLLVREYLVQRLQIHPRDIEVKASIEGVWVKITVHGIVHDWSISAKDRADYHALRDAMQGIGDEAMALIRESEVAHVPPRQPLVSTDNLTSAALLRDVARLLHDAEIPIRGARTVPEYKAYIREAVESLAMALAYRRSLEDETQELS